MSKKAVLGTMSLCYITTSNAHICDVIDDSIAKIVCINDSEIDDFEERSK